MISTDGTPSKKEYYISSSIAYNCADTIENMIEIQRYIIPDNTSAYERIWKKKFEFNVFRLYVNLETPYTHIYKYTYINMYIRTYVSVRFTVSADTKRDGMISPLAD